MRRFGGAHRNFKTRKPSFFSRTKKVVPFSSRRRIRHSAESLILRSRFQAYGQRGVMPNFWKIFKRCLLPALFLTWFGLLIFLPYFRVTKVAFYGLQIIKKDEVRDYLNSTIFKSHWGIFPGNNYFFLSSDGIEDALERQFSLGLIEVTKVFPNELHIEMQEKISSLIYENNGQYFLLDQSGSIIKFLGVETSTGFSTSTVNDPLTRFASIGVVAAGISSTTPGIATSTPAEPQPERAPNFNAVRNLFGNLPLLVDDSFVSSTDSEVTIVPEKVIKGALDFQEMLLKRGVATVKYFKLHNDGGGLVAYTSHRWIIHFDPTEDLESQFANLKMILKDNKPNQYVDLRYGERVYWK